MQAFKELDVELEGLTAQQEGADIHKPQCIAPSGQAGRSVSGVLTAVSSGVR